LKFRRSIGIQAGLLMRDPDGHVMRLLEKMNKAFYAFFGSTYHQGEKDG